MKTTSHFAMIAAAGLALSVAQASAADLGGNCCADLEERVAELEATTARKGNRKVSLTISGQVNRAIMYWNDGGRSNTYWGLDNTNSSTRFGFSGSAKIGGEWSAGYSIMIDVRDKARTVTADQGSPNSAIGEDGSSIAGNQNGDHLLRLRDANWWLQRDSLGRVTVGRLTTSGPTGVIDLGGVSVVAATGEGCIGTSLQFRDGNGALLGTTGTIGSFSASCAHPTTRNEGIKYTSPTLHGFVFSATLAEASKVEQVTVDGTVNIGRVFGVDLKYANEFNGVRVAAGIGYEASKLNEDDSGGAANADYTSWGLSGSMMHVATGLFVQGFYMESESAAPLAAGGFGPSKKADMFHIQAGVARNFFGLGNTVLYAEYAKFDDWRQMNTITSAGPVAGASDNMKIWGLGVVQNIDAAAMELYLGYRNYSASDSAVAQGIKDIDVVAAGARIRF